MVDRMGSDQPEKVSLETAEESSGVPRCSVQMSGTRYCPKPSQSMD